MRGLASVFGWTLLACTQASAQTPPTPEPWTAVRADAIRAHVEFLAGDLLEGRASASRGHDLAAAYVAAQFRQYGLKAAGDETDSYFQTVPLVEATPVLPGSTAEWAVAEQTSKFEYSTDYLPSADFLAVSSTIQAAPTVFAGYGIDAQELRHDDFAGLELKGRIAVIFSGAPSSFPNGARAYYSLPETKFAALIAHGAIGAVLIDSPADARRIPWERSIATSWMPQMRWLDASGKPQNAFPELKLRFRFNQDAAARMFSSTPVSFAEVLARAETGEPQGFELPGLMTLSATTGLRRTESMNVLAVLPGADPRLKREYIVVTAHLDHLGRGPSVSGDAIYNGAHDNALGVSILLEMARALSTVEPRPRRSILFAAVTAQEKGRLGSEYLAVNPPMPAEALVANVNVDMPLLMAPTLDFVALGSEHSSLGASARAAAIAQGYRISPDRTPEEQAFLRSDQFSFVRNGIPAIALRGGYQARERGVDPAELQRDFLKTQHRQPSDDRSVPMDFGNAADFTRVNLRLVQDLANGSARPRWKRGDFLASRYARNKP